MKVKKKLKPNDTKLGLNSITLNDIIIAIALCITLAILLINLLNQVLSYNNSSLQDEIYDFWEETFRSIAKDEVGINFMPITTTKPEWINLQHASNEFISKNGETKNKLVVSPKIQEEVYIDSDKIYSINKPADFSTESEKLLKLNYLGQIFFQDALLTRYVSQDGKMSVIMAINTHEDSSRSDFNIIEIVELNNSSEIKKYFVEFSDEENKKFPNLLSEKMYTDEIIDIIKGVYTSKSNKDIRDIKNRARKYFSSSGRKTIFEGKNKLGFKDEVTVDVNYAAMGKSQSNIDSEYKDRLFIQLSIYPLDNENQAVIVNIILKLDNYGYIFDIDLV